MHSRTRIKVCGITTTEDAKEAIRLGVDAIGFIFAEKSPRYITPEKAKEIVAELPPFVHFVGVFVDTDPVEVEEIIEYCDLSTVQLHGNEDPEYCQKLSQAAKSCRVIKAFRVGESTVASEFTTYEDCVEGFLLDTYVKGQEGGTGHPFDWSIIESLNLKLPVILAGGLGPGNIAEAISQVKPFAVDVNSGVEESPGKKNHEKLSALVVSVIAADNGPDE